MIEHSQQFKAAGIPFIFDPGQGLPMFDGDELKGLIDQATWLAVNDYEAEMLQQKTGLTAQQIAERVDAYIVTKGSEGSVIHTTDEIFNIPPAKAAAVVDPTGCGDAYRAGLLYGLMNDLDWNVTGRIAGIMGAVKIATAGTQNHSLTLEGLKEEYSQQFGGSI